MSKKALVCCAVILVFAIAVGTTAVVFFLESRNRVEVSVINIPPKTRFLCLVTEIGGSLETISWSPKYIVTGEIPPQECVWSYRSMNDRNALQHVYVIWKFGARYGVGRFDDEQIWWITWNDVRTTPMAGRQGGLVEFDLSQGVTQRLSSEQVKELGFQEMRFNGRFEDNK
jgi:hypothetical protein